MKKLFYPSFAALGWGLWVLNPLWHTFAQSRAFSILEQTMPEHFWGAGVACIGWLGLWAIRHGPRMEMLAALGLLFVWSLLAILLVLAAFESTGFVVYATFILLSADGYIAARLEYLRGKR